ncbi:MAG: A/G-specific adenine glycosylase [Acidobacteria bacterium]|nr:MAG: A/G-specific adenine glycosylase [Acidobacteriota bacterium]
MRLVAPAKGSPGKRCQCLTPFHDLQRGLHQIWDPVRIAKFQDALLAWYSEHQRALPWRSRPDPYRVWVSEIMLQQTQVQTVLRYFDRFVRRFPDARALAAASEEEVVSLWAGLGYYGRARNLRRAAIEIVRRHGGRFPSRFDEILRLPGVGRYTAGAIASIAFNLPEPIVDGNVRRVVSRLHALERGAPERFFWEQARAWTPAGRAAEFNQAVMELGALVCVPSSPLCLLCPVAAPCEARRTGIEARIPPPRRARAAEEVRLVMLVMEHEEEILLVREREADYIPGRWGLPTRALARGESPARAARALARSFSPEPGALEERGTVRHGVTFRRIAIQVFRGRLARRPRARGGDDGARWTPRAALDALVTSSAFRKAIRCCDGG